MDFDRTEMLSGPSYPLTKAYVKATSCKEDAISAWYCTTIGRHCDANGGSALVNGVGLWCRRVGPEQAICSWQLENLQVGRANVQSKKAVRE